MTSESKLFDKIRIAKRKPAAAKEAPSPENVCQWDGCTKPGVHKAPAGRHRENEYFLFCVEHVREYNRNYNYFSGLEDNEIAQFQKDAMIGHRPTWRMGTNPQELKAAPQFAQVRSGRAGYYRKVGANPFGDRDATPRQRVLKPLERKAFVTLGLRDDAEGETVRNRYAELVKQHHPDANGGVRGSEERLHAVIQAYRILKKAGFC